MIAKARLPLLLTLVLLGPLGCTAENPALDGDRDLGGGERDLSSGDGPIGWSCADTKAALQSILERSKDCKTDADCTIAVTACGLPAACDTDEVYVNVGWRSPEVERLLAGWAAAACGPAQCVCPKRPVRAPACNAGACGPKGVAPVGAPCTADSDCQTGECLTEAEDKRFLGGYCTLKSCDRIDRACPMGSACEPIARGESACLVTCDAMNLCRKGYSCCGPGPRLRGWCAPPESPVCLLR